jgi:AcrR family transcriptional regulator
VAALSAAQQRIHKAALQLFAERGHTQLTISELAEAAGIARGTVYNNLKNPQSLFEGVAAQLADDMVQRVEMLFGVIEDPAMRLATGLRLWLRRAHAEPQWGRFLVRFAFSSEALQQFWAGPPVADLQHGIQQGRYKVRQEQLASLVAMVAGTTLGAIFLVLEGRRTWRDAGSEAAELLLIALGLPREEAYALANAELPALPEGPSD